LGLRFGPPSVFAAIEGASADRPVPLMGLGKRGGKGFFVTVKKGGKKHLIMKM